MLQSIRKELFCFALKELIRIEFLRFCNHLEERVQDLLIQKAIIKQNNLQKKE
jgi:hypothetical protein